MLTFDAFAFVQCSIFFFVIAALGLRLAQFSGFDKKPEPQPQPEPAPELCADARACLTPALVAAAPGLDRLLASLPLADRHVLARLEVLVDLEEVLDLGQQLGPHVGGVRDARPGGVVVRDAEDLLVLARLVVHLQHADRAARHEAARETSARSRAAACRAGRRPRPASRAGSRSRTGRRRSHRACDRARRASSRASYSYLLRLPFGISTKATGRSGGVAFTLFESGRRLSGCASNHERRIIVTSATAHCVSSPSLARRDRRSQTVSVRPGAQHAAARDQQIARGRRQQIELELDRQDLAALRRQRHRRIAGGAVGDRRDHARVHVAVLLA